MSSVSLIDVVGIYDPYYFQPRMPFATGPWHTPPQLPDDAEELCLVLLFHRGEHHRYVAMRYADGWTYQDGQVIEAGTWVSRLHAELESSQHGSAISTLKGELRALENMRHSQMASKERRIGEQRAALVEMHEQIQKLKSQLAKAELRTQDLIQREAKQRRSAHTELGKLKQELNRLRMKLAKAR